MNFAADIPPLPADYSRCYDGPPLFCPLAPRCRRTEPVPPNTLVSQAMFFAESQQRGGCEHFIDNRGAA